MRDQVWALDESLLGPNPSHPTMDADAAYSIKIKAAAGYPVSFVDAYGRLLSYHLTYVPPPSQKRREIDERDAGTTRSLLQTL
jgi:hypothetical protein